MYALALCAVSKRLRKFGKRIKKSVRKFFKRIRVKFDLKFSFRIKTKKSKKKHG